MPLQICWTIELNKSIIFNLFRCETWNKCQRTPLSIQFHCNCWTNLNHGASEHTKQSNVSTANFSAIDDFAVVNTSVHARAHHIIRTVCCTSLFFSFFFFYFVSLLVCFCICLELKNVLYALIQSTVGWMYYFMLCKVNESNKKKITLLRIHLIYFFSGYLSSAETVQNLATLLSSLFLQTKIEYSI